MNQHVTQMARFLWFCFGFRQAIASIRFTTTNGVSGEYVVPLGTSEQPTGNQIESIPLTFERIKTKTNEMIAHWFEFDQYARNSSVLITSLMGNWDMPLDMHFLASAQALEAASRSNVDEQEISNEVLRSKIEAINTLNMDKKLKCWVVHNVKNAKWKSADSLAKDLINKMKEYATLIIPNISKYMEDHRSHRNAYTHRRDIEESERLSNEDLYIHTEATQLLAYGSIALFLGVEPSELIDAFRESGYRWNSIYRANRLYSLDVNDRTSEAENAR